MPRKFDFCFLNLLPNVVLKIRASRASDCSPESEELTLRPRDGDAFSHSEVFKIFDNITTQISIYLPDWTKSPAFFAWCLQM